DGGVHLLERLLVDVGDDQVEPVVDRTVAVGLLTPRLVSLHEAPASGLDGEVDDRGGATPGGRPGAGLEGVGGEGAPERQLHVGVDVDAAGDDVLAGGVDRLVGRPVVASGRGQGDDLLVLDEDIGGHPVGGGDDGSVG